MTYDDCVIIILLCSIDRYLHSFTCVFRLKRRVLTFVLHLVLFVSKICRFVGGITRWWVAIWWRFGPFFLCKKGRLQWNFLGIDSSKLCDTSANCGQVLIQLIWSNFGANCKTLLGFLLEKEHCQYWLSFVSSYPNQHLVPRYVMGWLQWLFCE